MNELFYLKSAENFRESLLIGNGRLGAIVYGGVNEDVYKLNDDTLWSGYPRNYTVQGTEIFEQVKKYILNDEPDKAEPLLERLYGTYGQCYLPAGTLKITADYGAYSDYKRSLSLKDAVHHVDFGTKRGRYTRTAFASHPHDVICVRYNGDQRLPDLDISLDSELRHNVCFEDGTVILEGEAPNNGVPSYIATDERFTYGDTDEERGMRYSIALRIRSDGLAVFENGVLHVSDSSFLEIYLTVKTSFAGYDKHPYLDGIDYKTRVIEILDRISSIPYDDLLARHIEDYSSLFDRVHFELEGGRPDLPTDERLKAHGETPDVGLYALMYHFGRYLMISSSRKGTQATNLQGIWNEETAAPWSSNYTVNINTQMNYWGVCGANLAECCEPLHRMIYELFESGKSTARDWFGAEGFCANHNVDIWRITHPVGNWRHGSTSFSYFPLAGAWLVRHLYDYYLETRDPDFLNGKAFTAILESARFCDSMLTEHHGQLIFAPASSPENRYLKDGQKYAIAKSSTMFQSIVRDVFEICIESARVTNRETEYANYLEERLQRIPWIPIGEDGRVLEWDGERDEYEPTHRHLSHLYSFYPAKKVQDENLLEACKKTLEARGDESTGWSSVWKTCLWATLKDGDRALTLADQLLAYLDSNIKRGRGGTYPNLLCACPPAQIDGNFGYVAAVNEILVQENNGEIELLPALPSLWKNGKITGLRLHGKTVDVEWRDGKIVSSRIE